MTRWLRPLPPTSTVVDGDYVSADSHLGFGVSRQPRDISIVRTLPPAAGAELHRRRRRLGSA
jgi:hypothetical protein